MCLQILKLKFNREETGIVGILAIVVLGILTLTALTLSGIIINQLKVASSIEASEEAYYAAEAGAEHALLVYKNDNSDGTKDLRGGFGAPFNWGVATICTSWYSLQYGATTDPQNSYQVCRTLVQNPITLSKELSEFTSLGRHCEGTKCTHRKIKISGFLTAPPSGFTAPPIKWEEVPYNE